MITRPLPFQDALEYLVQKEQLPAEWDAAEWAAQEADFRNRAFFISKVEHARFIDRAQGLLFDYMAKVRDEVTTPAGERTTALRVAGREHFVKLMRDFMIAEGMARPGEFKDVNQKDVEDIRSLARLRLIFDTNVRQAYGYGQWKQGMTPAVLKAYPAARLIRDMGVKVPRPRHEAHLGDVMLKTDPRWAEYHNAKEIGGFGVPWGPYGFNSGVTQEDVPKDEWKKLDPSARAEPVRADAPPMGINDGLSASLRNMDPELKRKLIAELRGGPEPRDIREVAREAAATARRDALGRGLADAEKRGDHTLAVKYRQAIAALPTGSRMAVREDGDKIMLEKTGIPGNVPPLPDETNRPPQGFQPAEVLAGIRAFRATESGGAGFAREIRSDREAESLARWADAKGVLTTESRAPQPDELTGGEHMVTLDDSNGVVAKATHPGKFGFAADLEMIHPRGSQSKPRITAGLVDATPEEYLLRMNWQNDLFGDDVQIMGAVKYPQGLSVLTTQPFYDGKRTEQPEIDSWFISSGWRKLPLKDGAFYDEARDLLILDALPRNVLTLADGNLMPFDVVIVRPDEMLKSRLGL